MSSAVQAALDEVRRFCDGRLPAELRDEVVLEAGVRGNAITIVERRAPWNPDYGPDWTSMSVAQLRFDPAAGAWSLYSRTSGGRWARHPAPSGAADVARLLAVIDEDPYARFWG
jgi:hypothetical protein